MRNNKIAIIGAGTVGATIAEQAALTSTADEIVLIDEREKKAKVEVADLTHALALYNKSCKVYKGEYKDCANADIAVITLSSPNIQGQAKSIFVENAKKIVEPIVKEVMKSGFNGIFIVSTKPVDVMSYYVWKLSGLPANRVIGTGCALHTARLVSSLSERYDISPANIQAYTMGEHSDGELIPWSTVSIYGKSINDMIKDNPIMSEKFDKDQILEDIIEVGREIADVKMIGNYGVAAETVKIINAILRNEDAVMSVSINVNGYYGLGECYLSVPAIINRDGAVEALALHLNDEELKKLQSAADGLKEYNEMLF